jgi:hypothetical protein
MDLSRYGSPSRPAGPHRPVASWPERWRRLSPLARDIVIVLVLKAIVLTLLWFAFFRAPLARHMSMDPGRVGDRIVAPLAPSEPAHAVR